MDKERIDEIDIAKGIGILLVVLGHSFPDANTGIINDFARNIFTWIYSFHMALFMMFAGVLFCKNTCYYDSHNFKKIIKKKLKRLMIPYLFYSLLLFFGKTVLGAFSRKEVSYHTFLDILVGNSPCRNCWFLYVLFVLIIIALLLPKKLFPEYFIVISLILYFFQTDSGWINEYGLSRICKMAIWFSIGLLISKYGNVFWNKLRKMKIHINLSLILCIGALQILLIKNSGVFNSTLLSMLCKLILAAIGCLQIIFLSCMINLSKPSVKKVFIFLGKESMTIYLLSYFIQTPGVTIYRLMGNIGVPYFIWVIVLMIVAIAFPIAVGRIIKKSKSLKLLLIGS